MDSMKTSQLSGSSQTVNREQIFVDQEVHCLKMNMRKFGGKERTENKICTGRQRVENHAVRRVKPQNKYNSGLYKTRTFLGDKQQQHTSKDIENIQNENNQSAKPQLGFFRVKSTMRLFNQPHKSCLTRFIERLSRTRNPAGDKQRNVKTSAAEQVPKAKRTTNVQNPASGADIAKNRQTGQHVLENVMDPDATYLEPKCSHVHLDGSSSPAAMLRKTSQRKARNRSKSKKTRADIKAPFKNLAVQTSLVAFKTDQSTGTSFGPLIRESVNEFEENYAKALLQINSAKMHQQNHSLQEPSKAQQPQSLTQTKVNLTDRGVQCDPAQDGKDDASSMSSDKIPPSRTGDSIFHDCLEEPISLPSHEATPRKEQEEEQSFAEATFKSIEADDKVEPVPHFLPMRDPIGDGWPGCKKRASKSILVTSIRSSVSSLVGDPMDLQTFPREPAAGADGSRKRTKPRPKSIEASSRYKARALSKTPKENAKVGQGRVVQGMKKTKRPLKQKSGKMAPPKSQTASEHFNILRCEDLPLKYLRSGKVDLEWLLTSLFGKRQDVPVVITAVRRDDGQFLLESLRTPKAAPDIIGHGGIGGLRKSSLGRSKNFGVGQHCHHHHQQQQQQQHHHQHPVVCQDGADCCCHGIGLQMHPACFNSAVNNFTSDALNSSGGDFHLHAQTVI